MLVTLRDIRLELRVPIATSRGVITHRDGTLVRVSDGDFTGWGEALPLPGWPGADLSATRRALQAWSENPEKLPQERFARGAVELALLDLESRQSGLYPAEVLTQGAPAAQSIELNALVQTPDAAAAAAAAGYRTVKLKVGAAPPEEDISAVQAVRAAIGPQTRLRLDANGAWTVDQAVAMLNQLAPYDIEYVEEPVPTMAALAEVAERSPVPVAVDDSLISADALVPPSIPVIVVKPMALGGPRTALAAARHWLSHGHQVVITNYLDSAIGQMAALAVAAALPGPPTVHGAITPDLFVQDLAPLPPVVHGHAPVSFRPELFIAEE